MSQEYNEYLTNHIQNVMEGIHFFKDYLPEILYDEHGGYIGYELEKMAMKHDESKKTPEEYEAYDNYFYGDSKSKKVLDEFNLAWLHHIHNNQHHWQHWVLMEDDPKTKDDVLIEIPNIYIFEMVCDWWSFSWQKGNLNEIFKWYDDHKATIKLHPKSRIKVEEVLSKLKGAIKLVYDGGRT